MEEKAHRTLVTLYGHVFDADGAHPVTLSHLRLGRYAAPEQAQASLMAWTEALLEGRYPLYAGCQQALQEARALAQGRLADMEDRPVLLERLALIEKALDFFNALRPRSGRSMGYSPRAGLSIGSVSPMERVFSCIWARLKVVARWAFYSTGPS